MTADDVVQNSFSCEIFAQRKFQKQKITEPFSVLRLTHSSREERRAPLAFTSKTASNVSHKMESADHLNRLPQEVVNSPPSSSFSVVTTPSSLLQPQRTRSVSLADAPPMLANDWQGPKTPPTLPDFVGIHQGGTRSPSRLPSVRLMPRNLPIAVEDIDQSWGYSDRLRQEDTIQDDHEMAHIAHLASTRRAPLPLIPARLSSVTTPLASTIKMKTSTSRRDAYLASLSVAHHSMMG